MSAQGERDSEPGARNSEEEDTSDNIPGNNHPADHQQELTVRFYLHPELHEEWNLAAGFYREKCAGNGFVMCS